MPIIGDGNSDEIEGIVIAKTTSYVAIGKLEEQSNCYKFYELKF